MSNADNDFAELSSDVSGLPLWNRDLAPTKLEQRTWSTWNIAALWIGMSVVITTYTLGIECSRRNEIWCIVSGDY